MALSPGTILQNRYRIAKLVGQGGFGAVYRGWDIALEQPVAVKENFDSGPESQRQFEREAKLLAGLRHPNLPRVGDHFSVPGQGQYLVMDFVEGKSLEELLAERGGPLGEAEALPWIRQVCDALTYLHTRTPPIIHRDIKPQNIIVTAEGRAMLVDFGISKVYDPTKGTTVGAKAVTPGYSPPEQYGRGRTDARSDVYALGATLYTLLTGHAPPEAPDLSSGADVLTPPRGVNPAVSEATSRAVVAAMALSMSQRLGDAASFERVLPSRATTPPAAPTVGPALRRSVTPASPQRGTPGWAWLVGLAAVVALGVWAAITFGGLNGSSPVWQATVTIEAIVAGEMPKPTATTVARTPNGPVTATAETLSEGPTPSPTAQPTLTTTLTPTATPATTVGNGLLLDPNGVTVDADGNVYVADTGNSRIQKFTSEGVFLTTWGRRGTEPGQLNGPMGIAVDAAGNVYVADYGNSRIQKFAADGTFLDTWGSKGKEQGQFMSPMGVAVDPAGNVYVADTFNHRIQKFAADGTFLGLWGSEGTGQGRLRFPQSIAADVDGIIYVADTNNQRIQQFAADGAFLSEWKSLGDEPGQFSSPNGITVATDGTIYVTDPYRVQKFDADGVFLGAWGSLGTGQGQFRALHDIAVDGKGNVYVADTFHRIQKFTADGEFLAMWGGKE